MLLTHPGGGREGASCPSLREQVPPADGTASGPVTGNAVKRSSEEARQWQSRASSSPSASRFLAAVPHLKGGEPTSPLSSILEGARAPHPSGSQALIQNGPAALVKPGTSKLAGLAVDPESITNLRIIIRTSCVLVNRVVWRTILAPDAGPWGAARSAPCPLATAYRARRRVLPRFDCGRTN